jgi:hypothetical protein
VSSISGIQAGLQPNLHSVVSRVKTVPPAAAAPVRDADGDFDGTAVGQLDAKAFGKGGRIDRQA